MHVKLSVTFIRRKISPKLNYRPTYKTRAQTLIIFLVIVYSIHCGKLYKIFVGHSQEYKYHKEVTNQRCSTFNHVGFLNFHKIESSTVFNILARYPLKNSVAVATLPPPRSRLCYPGRFSRSSKCILKPESIAMQICFLITSYCSRRLKQ